MALKSQRIAIAIFIMTKFFIFRLAYNATLYPITDSQNISGYY